MAHADLRYENILIYQDTREKDPFDLAPMKVQTATLETGDYSIAGLTKRVALERKALSDLVMCCGQERERFEREMQRIQSYESRLVIVEAPWSAIEMKTYRGKILPDVIQGSILGWMDQKIPFWFASSKQEASAMAKRFLYIAARRRWRELQSMLPHLKIAT